MTEVITEVMNLEEKIDSLTSIHSERMLMLHRERERRLGFKTRKVLIWGSVHEGYYEIRK